ncbi:MAG TPA: YajQ family cyclic di-GMP-binding protein [Chloroflexia bacterium]|nr:YajQ family cyclic di-GMP-binding protein [Chloroflexia bacterium]
MAGTVSFDLVSDFDRQELVNAVDQAMREIHTRYDLKDSKSDIKLEDERLVITSDSEHHLTAIKDLLETKVLRRNLSLKILDWGKVEEAAGNTARQIVTLRKGIADDLARKINKQIREQFPKTQPQVQGDALRIQAKSKDELQAVIKYLREHEADFPVPLQFTNYR